MTLLEALQKLLDYADNIDMYRAGHEAEAEATRLDNEIDEIRLRLRRITEKYEVSPLATIGDHERYLDALERSEEATINQEV